MERKERKRGHAMDNLLLMVLPTLAPDFSGVCSTLFELGGIIAIHDPGGCTGSYTGYDEPRWFDQKSKVFTTSLDDVEAVFGDDRIVVSKICAAHEELGSNFVAFLGSPSPMVIGTDYAALASILQKKTGTPAIPFDTKGTEFYDVGIEMALMSIAKHFLPEDIPEKKKNMVNVLGATPLDLTNTHNVEVIGKILQDAGYTIGSMWCMGTTLKEIHESAKAQCNIVLTASALKVAEYLKEKYGTPYIVGRFSGDVAVQDFLHHLANLMQGIPLEENVEETKQEGKSALIVGEQFLSDGIRQFLLRDLGYRHVVVASFFNMKEQYTQPTDIVGLTEERFIELTADKSYDVVIGDGLLKRLLDKKFTGDFIELPHVSISSRLSWNTQICQFGKEAFDMMKLPVEQ